MQSETIGKLAEALAKAQGEMSHARKDAANPAFKRDGKASTYADLSDVIDAIRGPFSKHALAYVQAIHPEPDVAKVETIIMHSSGEWVSGTISLPVAAKTAHGFGSAITYARRYLLASMSGVTQADDDGNTASGVTPVQQAPAVKPLHDVADDVSDLYEKAAILASYRGTSAQQIVSEFSEYKGKGIDSPEHARKYLTGKPDGKWVSMTARKIGDEIAKLATSSVTDEDLGGMAG